MLFLHSLKFYQVTIYKKGDSILYNNFHIVICSAKNFRKKFCFVCPFPLKYKAYSRTDMHHVRHWPQSSPRLIIMCGTR